MVRPEFQPLVSAIDPSSWHAHWKLSSVTGTSYFSIRPRNTPSVLLTDYAPKTVSAQSVNSDVSWWAIEKADQSLTTSQYSYGYGAKVWGGSGGGAFDDIAVLEQGVNLYITKIGLRAGSRVDQVSLTYSNGVTVSHGGSGGSAKSKNMTSSTTLKKVKVCKDYTSKYNSTTVHYIKFTVSDGSTLSGGTQRGSCVTLKSNKGYPIVGFRGRSGTELDSLGIIIEQPIGDL